MSICPIEKLIQFDLLDDCIHTPAGYYHFYRYYPPNTDIMTEEEKKAEIEQMTQLFDTLAREIAIFATDKIEDMSEIKRFYKNLAPEYDHLTSDIIAAIESTESRNSAAVQRAFYFIIRTDKQEESVYNQIAGKGYHINKAQREELAVLLRNYYLREFISAEIYTLEKELKQDVKLRKKIEKKPELFQKELQRRLLPHSMEFFPSFAVQNGTYRSTMMLKNFPFEIGSCCLLQTACMRGTSFMMRLTPMNGREIKKLTEKQMNKSSYKRSSTQATDQLEGLSEQTALAEFYQAVSNSQTTLFFVSVYACVKELARASGIPVKKEQLPSISLHGYYSPSENAITINSNLEDTKAAVTLCHEYAHGLLHRTSTQSEAICEFEAQSLALMLMARYGLPQDDSEIGYMKTYLERANNDKNFSLDTSLERLQKQLKFVDERISLIAEHRQTEFAQTRAQAREPGKGKQVSENFRVGL